MKGNIETRSSTRKKRKCDCVSAKPKVWRLAKSTSRTRVSRYEAQGMQSKEEEGDSATSACLKFPLETIGSTERRATVENSGLLSNHNQI